MYNTSQIFMLLLNIYFNLGMIHPFLQRNEFARLSKATLDVFEIRLPIHISVEGDIDELMQAYVNTLTEVKNIKDDAKAITAMKIAGKEFMRRAQKIKPELKQYLSTMSEKEASAYRERLLIKPYFKDINDIAFAYRLSSKLDSNSELRESFEAMDDFLTILYN